MLRSFLDVCARYSIKPLLRTVPGAAAVYPEPLTSSQYLNVRVDRERAARFGLTVSAVQDVIRTAIGERNLTLTLEGRQRFPVRVRYASEYRADPRALGCRWPWGFSPMRLPRGFCALPSSTPSSGPWGVADRGHPRPRVAPGLSPNIL